MIEAHLTVVTHPLRCRAGGPIGLIAPKDAVVVAPIATASAIISGIADEIAVGTGAGLRYDLSFLVIRVDCGVALHLPYTTSRKGYYNIPKFKDGLGWHLAIGYPF